MKKFNYELLENRKDQLVQDNSKEDRVYHAPKGTYPSITNLLYHIISKPGIEKWKARVGEEAAQKISTKAARRGTRIHKYIERYMEGDADYLKKSPPDHKEMVNLVVPQINEKIDNIRGIELGMWSDGLKVAGTSDLVADYEGELAVIDWKTAAYIKKEEYLLSYILQGTAYCRMLYEMYGLLPKKIVICSLIRFDPMKYNPLLDEDIHIDWKVYNPLDYIRQLKSVCDAFHFSKK
jgi:hypothetical protein